MKSHARCRCIALLVALLFLSACSSKQAIIHSEPPGAMVLIDGKEIGQTPLHYDYHLSSGKKHDIQVKRQGYEEIAMTIKADKVDSGALKGWLMAGLVWSPLWLGTFFTKKLKESYLFVMKRDEPTLTAKLTP